MKGKTYKAIGGTCGVLPYLEGNNSIGVFLSPEELVKSCDKFKNTPVVTQKHAVNGVTEDIKVGIVSDAYPIDEYSIGIDLLIWDKEAQKYIDDGNNELSAGYDAVLVKEDKDWYGSTYSYSKKDLVYDHLAILPPNTVRNRKTKILNSSLENENKFTTFFENFKLLDSGIEPPKPNKMVKKFINIPGFKDQFEVDNEVVEHIQHLTNQTQTLTAKVNDSANIESNLTNVRTELDEVKIQLADANTKVASLEETKKSVEKLIPKYVQIATKAEKLGVEINYDKFDALAIMKSALKTKYADIENQDESVVNYLFSQVKVSEPESTDETKTTTPETTSKVQDTAKNSSGLGGVIGNVKPNPKVDEVMDSLTFSLKMAEKRAKSKPYNPATTK